MKILCTGFEGFGGDAINPSEKVCNQLEGFLEEESRVYTLILPVSFLKAPLLLKEKMLELKPEIVLCFGYSAKATCLCLERVALNIEDARIPDNDNNQPIDIAIQPTGSLALETLLPLRELLNFLKQEQIPAQISYSAGSYVCNALFYSLLQYCQSPDTLNTYQWHRRPIPWPGVPKMAGFIHLPALPEQALDKRDQPFLPLQYMVEACKKIIRWLSLQECFRSPL